ncbi:MAG: hypothetical protein AMXMBFR59_41930 [Rhodanobacteraceae bacterium]
MAGDDRKSRATMRGNGDMADSGRRLGGSLGSNVSISGALRALSAHAWQNRVSQWQMLTGIRRRSGHPQFHVRFGHAEDQDTHGSTTRRSGHPQFHERFGHVRFMGSGEQADEPGARKMPRGTCSF